MIHHSRKLAAVTALVVAGSVAACSSDRRSINTPPPGDRAATLEGTITQNRRLHADTAYTLSGFVKVAQGATLTIDAGTRIVGDTLVPGSALFILRGAQINANGTAQAPIIFTSARSLGNRAPGDWGGLIIVGNAGSNRTQAIIEGSDANVPGGGPPGVTYTGGTNDADNSGTLRYVRVEFAGFGVAQDQELNSFTFGAVGSGTTVEYLQAIAGLDDHFEWFGGTMNARYLVSYECADDHFDAAEGYRGKLQFIIGYQTDVLPVRPGTGQPSSDPQGFEVDGCAGTGCALGQLSEPYTMPFWANFTLVGPGPNVYPAGGGRAMVLRRGTGGTYINGIVARWRTGISIRDASTDQLRAADSLVLRNILLTQQDVSHLDVHNPGGGIYTDPANFATAALDSTSAANAGVLFSALPALGILPTAGTLDWTPAGDSPAASGGLDTFTGVIAARAGEFIQPTAYRGAADPNGPKWWDGWTVYFRN